MGICDGALSPAHSSSFFINFCELTMSRMENSVDPDQLVSEGASCSGSTLFTVWLHTVFKRLCMVIDKLRNKRLIVFQDYM